MCQDGDILHIFYIIGTLINIAKVVVPLIIIVLVSLDFSKIMFNASSEEMKKQFKKLAYRLVAAVLVFFVPTIMNTAFNVVDSTYSVNNLNCLLSVSKQEVDTVRLSNAEDAVTKAEKHLTDENVKDAEYRVSRLDDSDQKNILEDRLNEVKDKVYPQTIIDFFPTRKNTDSSNTSGVSNPSYNGEFKYYNQCDQKWSSVNSYNVCRCGCGYTSIAMVVDSLTGSNNTPINIVKSYGLSSSSCAASDDKLLNTSIIQNKYGVKPEKLFGRNNKADDAEQANRKQIVASALENGKMVILLIPGHFIVLGGINNGKISVYDPASSSRNGNYTIDELYNEYYDNKNFNGGSQKGFVYAVAYERV